MKEPNDFNSRPSARGDSVHGDLAFSFREFQFTPLREGRLHEASLMLANSFISIHAPPRGATASKQGLSLIVVISIHAPPRGATFLLAHFSLALIFQFTPLREGRPFSRHSFASPSHFNSRPSARGDVHGIRRERFRGFQFTPLREGRRLGQASGNVPKDFNSRPSARGDNKKTARVWLELRISIHAPPRGATKRNGKDSPTRRHFNSRPSARGDCITIGAIGSRDEFQFTPLREGRHTAEEAYKAALNFNSRPSARGDEEAESKAYKAATNFNSRPSARGDFGSWFCECTACNFNSRPSARGDFWHVSACLSQTISIHAPPRGATSAKIAMYCRDIFQFTPLREGRPLTAEADASPCIFQFTPLREGRRQKICNFCKSFVQPLQISMA